VGGRINWLDILTGLVGILFLALSALSVIATVTVIATWGDPEPSFPVGESFLQGLRGFAAIFFPVAAFVTAAAGWWLAGDQIKSTYRRLRSGDEE
jgi:hypothetical protein